MVSSGFLQNVLPWYIKWVTDNLRWEKIQTNNEQQRKQQRKQQQVRTVAFAMWNNVLLRSNEKNSDKNKQNSSGANQNPKKNNGTGTSKNGAFCTAETKGTSMVGNGGAVLG